MTRQDEWHRSIRVLGLHDDAEFNEIQNAYRKLVLKFHPDLNRMMNAPTRFREIVEAYGTILELNRSKTAVSGEKLYMKVKEDPIIRGMGLEELENRLRYSSSPKLRAGVLVALSVQGGDRAKRLLFEALRDINENVTITALQMLGDTCRLKDIPRVFLFLSCIRNRNVLKNTLKMIFHVIRRTLNSSGIKRTAACSEKEMAF